METKRHIAIAAAALMLLVAIPAHAAVDPDAPRLPNYPEAKVRAWQVGLLRPDRLQHLGLAFTAGAMAGLTSESPAAAAGTALGLGLVKELWDMRHTSFDFVDLAADAVGAVGAAAATRHYTQ